MKYTILFLFFLNIIPEQQDFKKITLFNNRFSYSVPKGMIETEPLFSWDDDFRYVKYHSSKDSCIRIEVSVRYAQLNQLQAYQDQEAGPLLTRLDAVNERVISNEFKVIKGKKVILITCEYDQPKRKLNKGQAMRVVFNTSAGFTSVIMSHNYKNESDKEDGKKLFSTIIEKLEMH